MEWYERYSRQLELVFNKAKEHIASFPPPIHLIGLQYIQKFNPLDNDGGVDYICTLLPYWMQEATGISDEQCERLALANVYGMLYFFIQDDCMDGNVATGWKEQLALGNLLYLSMFAEFRELFPSDSPFWHYYERYVAIWADSVVNESASNYFITDPLRTAGKAGPVKISCVGAWLLAGKAEEIAASEGAVDFVLMTLQMLDDWADWQTDFEDGSYNGLLAMIAQKLGLRRGTADSGTTSGPLTREQVRTAIYVQGCLREFAEIAESNHDRLAALPSHIEPLLQFHRYMIVSLRAAAIEIDDRKRKLLGGGLNLLS